MVVFTVNNRFFIEMIKKYFYLFLAIILLVASYLRMTRMDQVPPHLGNDEISIAFDSYSVRSIGRDEHGFSWPLSFKSHQTYKAPLYAYLNMPLNWLFGNNEYGVRFLSAISGVLMVLLVALIAKEWSNSSVALIAALIMALDPKSLFVSRIAFESNLAALVVSFGVFLMYFYQKTGKKIWAFWAGMILALSIWSYHTEWGLAPMLVVFLPWISRKKISLKKWWLVWLTLVIVALPIFYNFLTVQRKDINNRANSQIWIFSGQIKDYLKSSDDWWLKKMIYVAVFPINNYCQHFSFDILFTNGTDMFSGESPLESGWFLTALLPLLILGLINIKKVYKENWKWLLAWCLLCPIVPSLTYEGVSSVRNLAFLVPMTLIMAGGLIICGQKSKIWTLIITVLLAFNFLVFALGYYIHFPISSGNGFQYGYKQAWEFIKPNIENYDRVVVENRFGEFGQFSGVPHLYFGYFKAFKVEDMQRRIDNSGTKIGKFEFKYVDWNQEVYTPKTIYIVSVINPRAGSFYNQLKEIGMIRNTDFVPQFLIYETVDK